MKLHTLLAVSAASLLFVFGSCKKGDMGPEGPQGPQGPQGPVGSPNVIYSEWYTPDSYSKDTVVNIWGFNYNKAAPGITQAVLDSGVVLTYAKLTGYISTVWNPDEVAALPISITYMSGDLQVDSWQAFASVGNLRIRFCNINNLYGSIANTHQFRYVIIPGGVKSARRDYSYAEISRTYNIPD